MINCPVHGLINSEYCVLCNQAEQPSPTAAMDAAKGTDQLNPKDLAGSKKAPLSLLPVCSLPEISKVMELGAKKYGPMNWRKTPIGRRAYLEAIIRHACQALAGEDTDAESGKSHEAHIAATAMIVIDARENGTLKDDRLPPGAMSAALDAVKEE